eukprot:COSAG06_NODE_1796_length_8371_cov_58.788201_6_plen_80_part_00
MPDHYGCGNVFLEPFSNSKNAKIRQDVLGTSTEEKAEKGRDVSVGVNTANLVFGDGGDVFVCGAGHVWRLQRKVPAASI